MVEIISNICRAKKKIVLKISEALKDIHNKKNDGPSAQSQHTANVVNVSLFEIKEYIHMHSVRTVHCLLRTHESTNSIEEY